MIDENSPEQWVFIPKTLSQYLINNYGEVRQMVNGKQILVHRLRTDNYLKVRINGKPTAVHRLLAAAFLPKINRKPLVRFKDGNTENLALSNLEWIGYDELRDSKLAPFFERVRIRPKRKMNHYASTKKVLPEIARYANQGEPVKYIAYMTKLSEVHIRHLIRKYNYGKT